MLSLLHVMQKAWLAGLVLAFCGVQANAAVITVSSSDVPKTFVDNDPTGFTSTLVGPNLVISDLNFIFDRLLHTSVSDIHLELTSPMGTNVVLLKAFTEGGILTGLGTPDDFIGTIFDDDAPTNLIAGVAPYTGSFNIEHASVVTNPLSQFDGENALGTWTLFASDLAEFDVGKLKKWSLRFKGDVVPEPSSIVLFGLGAVSLLGYGWRRKRKQAA
jgi:subtilisin-like proprotein convertase family protein